MLPTFMLLPMCKTSLNSRLVNSIPENITSYKAIDYKYRDTPMRVCMRKQEIAWEMP